MHRTAAQQWIIDTFSDPWWDLMLLANLVLLVAWLIMRKRWHAQDEAGHIAAEKKREQLKQTRKV